MKLIKIIFITLFTISPINAEEYDDVVAGGQTQYEVVKEKVVKVVQSIVAVGGNLAYVSNDEKQERIFISSISAEEINIGFSRINFQGASTTATALTLGRCKINAEILVRADNTKPAIRIKLLSVDMENATATVLVSKLWPYPNSNSVKEVDPPTNAEAVLTK